MKIENINTNTMQMLQKGVLENSENRIKALEAQRMKEALETKKTVSSLIENKGIYFDTKV